MIESLILKVYVAGMTPAASRAIRNLELICAEISDDHQYRIQVVNILENPRLAEDEKILATPTVVKELPPPVRRLVGDLSDKEQVLIGLDLIPGSKI